MGNILTINKITDDREKAKEITNRVIERGTREGRRFGDILQEEINKIKEKATKEPTKVSEVAKVNISRPLYHKFRRQV
ncbi:hypothetical protein U728_1124 [Clostridium botulinum 202F]|nr:hypothetical protein U728_1124 [Clostridium botulinum 202F]KAI3344404.1 hypothetical protein CIT17_17450 [Clostridium botulinum]KON13574.1 hypothetical protein ACP50_05780 [Clostridium botulinum]MBY6987113.1 hypothetical protein [Clostridium botulinum]NFH02195.1 hypothetical protein [Clostridium botulinum]